jgi:hypothetical protein
VTQSSVEVVQDPELSKDLEDGKIKRFDCYPEGSIISIVATSRGRDLYRRTESERLRYENQPCR